MADTLPSFSPSRKNLLFRPILFLLDYFRHSSKKDGGSNDEIRKDESSEGIQLNEAEKSKPVSEVVQSDMPQKSSLVIRQ
jgi:hypothetical protein